MAGITQNRKKPYSLLSMWSFERLRIECELGFVNDMYIYNIYLYFYIYKYMYVLWGSQYIHKAPLTENLCIYIIYIYAYIYIYI